MSDLSQPPLSLIPGDAAAPKRPTAGNQGREPGTGGTPPAKPQPAAPAFAWPVPSYAGYPAPSPQTGPEPCEIEGLNGQVMRGRLIAFVPSEQLAHVHLPPARTTLPLRFEQFRSLTLVRPLQPPPPRADEPLRPRPRTPYQLAYTDGREVEGTTIGELENASGLYLFHPIDSLDNVRRVFVPRHAYRVFQFGSQLDDLLEKTRPLLPRDMLDDHEGGHEDREHSERQRLGDMMLVRQAQTPEQLLQSLEQQNRMPMVRVGEALLGLGLITPQQLDAALEMQVTDRSVPLGEVLVRMGLVSRQDLQTALARKMGYPLVDVGRFPVDTEALRKVPASVAHRLQALPLMVCGSGLVLAVADPTRRSVLEELEFVAQTKIIPVLAQHADIENALRTAYQKVGASGWGEDHHDPFDLEGANAGKLAETLEREQLDRKGSDDEGQIEQSDNSLVRLIHQMIIEAWQQGVSDIHVESHPGRQKVKIRFRKDGVLHPYLELPHTYRNAVIGRIKIMCDLDISERRKPQDGKINFARFSPQHRLELRVATIPTSNGLEDVVMRLLASAKPLPLDKLDLSPDNLKALVTAVERPYGMVLCVGPTGSGKTTMLHSALARINVPERKIWTAEDPVEITQPGLRQVQVNPKIDWTFEKALRAFLRADPDVIMVGEIRDAETAHVAVEASLTGHLVLSTLHTNSAPETVTRLLDMGLDPFNFGDSLLAVLAQRLVRRLCTHCRRARPATEAELEELMADWLQPMPKDDPHWNRETLRAEWIARHGRDGRIMRFDHPGCEHCKGTGYAGRVAIHELMTVTRELRRLVQGGARAEELQALALSQGMRTLRQDGLDKVLAGLTSLDEVRATSNV